MSAFAGDSDSSPPVASTPASGEDAVSAVRDAERDRACLLRYVLEREWSRCVLPVGLTAPADANLDAVDVPALVDALRRPGGAPDLRGALARANPSGSSSAPSARDDDAPPVVTLTSLLTVNTTTTAAAAAAPSAIPQPSSAAPQPSTTARSLALVRGLPGISEGSAPAPPPADVAGVAAPVPDLILPPLRGGPPLDDPDALALCAFEMFLARVGADDPASPAAADLADVVRMALEISPNADRAARALVAPHLERIRAEARETAEIGVGVRVHLRLMAEAGGCGVGVSDEDAVSAFGSDPAAAARSRAATVRRHAAALLETLWAAHDREWDEERTARHSHPRGADRRGGEADFVAEFEHDDDDDARRGGAHVGATIEETSRLVSLLDDALVVVDGGLEALAATTEALSEMIESALDALGPRAWRYPPALAGRVYAQLLRASFDPVDEGAVSDDLDAFRDALLHPEGAARAMGIRPAAHAALHAWCLARHHRAWIVGEGPLATSPTTARSAGARAFAFAADAEADADEPEEAYALLTAATRALARVEDAERDEREMTRHVGREESLDADVGVAGSNPGLEAESVLVHAATGPVAWWAEGALGDFFQDTSPPAGSLARGPSRAALDPRRGPEMTPDGFEATLALGVAAARARATTAAAIAPDFTGDPRDAGRAAGRAFAVRICRHAVGEAYARLRATAYAVNSDAEIDADSDAKIHADSDAKIHAKSASGMRTLAEGCAALADAFEAHLSSRVSSAVGRTAATAAPAAIAEYFTADLCAWLDATPPLDASALAALAAARDFQSAVAAAVADRDDEEKARVFIDGPEDARGDETETRRFEPLRLEFRVAPLVFGWVAGRADVLRRATRRSVERETWRSVMDGWTGDPTSSSSDVGAALSAVELVRSAWDTLEAFWNLNLPAPVAALRALTEAVDGAFQEYAETAAAAEPPEAFAPPLPKLTRYKKDVVEAMRAAHEEEKRRGTWVWRGEADETAPWGAGPERLGPRGAAASADGGQTLGGADADVRGVGSPVASVAKSCAKLASLHFLRRKLDELEREVPARYAAMRASSGASDTPPDASTWLDGLLDGARQTTRSCAKKIANHLACKIVYWDLRGLFIDGLYRVGVRGGVRARAVVSRLEAALCEVADRLPGDAGVDARAEVASALLRAAAQGWTRVMLDGGPGRAFAETDHAALEEDLEEIRELFLAGGDGVPAPEVTAATRAAERLLVVMSLEFDVVRDAYVEAEAKDAAAGETVGARGVAASPGGGGRVGALDGSGGFGAETLLRVLCHREDRAASKFLKANMRLPKGDEGTVMSYANASVAKYFGRG